MPTEQRTIYIANQETPDKPIVNIGMDETIAIGRDPATCAIVLPAAETTISRTHCTISYKLNSRGEFREFQPLLLLTDKSSFGTSVNGKAMQKRGQRSIEVGDSISVGQRHCFVVGALTVPPVGTRKRALSQRNSSQEAAGVGSVTAFAPAADGGDVPAANRERIVPCEGVGAAKRPKLEPISQLLPDSCHASSAAMVVDDNAADGDDAWLSSAAATSARQSQNRAVAVEVKEEEEDMMDSYPQSSQNWTIEDDVGVGKRLQEAFEFVNLVKSDRKVEAPSQPGTQYSISATNFKKFKKAHQGACARPHELPTIVGMSDMVDFRSLTQQS